MNYGMIKTHDVADGEGIRVTLFVSGCRHHCKGCFQPETWDFKYGEEYTKQTEQYILDKLKPEYITGLTLLGGEPFEPENQRVLVELLRKVKELYPNKNIWAYSGYLLDEEIVPKMFGKVSEAERKPCHCEVTDELISYIDVLVDGEFVESLRNLALAFRGSSNQRVIDVKESLKQNNIILYI